MDERQITTRTTKIAEASAPCRTSKKLINRLEIIGGKDNFPADRWLARKVLAVAPDLPIGAQKNRDFLLRAARGVAKDGIDQYIDVGTGLPAATNLHEVVREIVPAARVVHVDNDPLVLLHARALLTGYPKDGTAFIDADVRDPERIEREAAYYLDLSRPVALSLGAVLHFIRDQDDPAAIVAHLMTALAPGSYLVLSHGTGDFRPEQANQAVQVYEDNGIPVRVRSRAEVAALVPAGMEILAPGVVPVHRWRPASNGGKVADGKVGIYGLVARKL
jgi:SAM-dependent methyltransferase